MTYTELTETDAKPSAEEAAALRVLQVARRNPTSLDNWKKIRPETQNEIFAELVKAVKGEG